MLVFKKEILKKIIEHCKKEFPLEACGVFAGKGNRVEKFFPLSNIEKDSMKFFADSKEQLKVFKEIENMRLELLGIYHSHPKSSAYPSEKDKELAFYPEIFYLIVSLVNFNNPEVRIFRIKEKEFVEEKIYKRGKSEK